MKITLVILSVRL